MVSREQIHPELAAEQAYIDRAYDRLADMRANAVALARTAMAEGQRGGTLQARYERDVITRVGLYRGEQLDIGDESLCFGRLDREDGERYYVGRRGVLDESRHPLVIDWRVPAAEPFYRATGMHPMGLAMRRHLLCRGRQLLAIEDDRFGHGDDLGLAGTGALVAALEQPRTGSMRDIVATVQAEQDEIIRADMQGILAVQGGPGTGKTAVALHRAAYLLFTYRARLERQGVMIVAPNRLFLRYIDQVLPALGETGAELVTIEDLVPDVAVTATDGPTAARAKGDPRMARAMGRAVAWYQREPSRDLVVAYEKHRLRVSRGRLAWLIRLARRNRKTHNRRRAMLHSIIVRDVFDAYMRAERAVDPLLPLTIDKREVVRELREDPAVLAVLDEMWPSLTPARVLRDLWADPAFLDEVAGRMLRPDERHALRRAPEAGWTHDDVPLLDELRMRVGVVRRLGIRERVDDRDEIETFGHILVDEVQDLSPMALRMIARRSRSGWMTIVGDLAQSVGAWTPPSWDDLVRALKPRNGWVRRELTINYRTPEEIMSLAERVRLTTAPGLAPARAVRRTGVDPVFVRTADVLGATVAAAREELDAVDGGTIAVIAGALMLPDLSRALEVPVVAAQDPAARLGNDITLADADTVKGLEFDGVVIVEPSRLVAEHGQGMRALYVALTRATKRLTVVYADELPRALRL